MVKETQSEYIERLHRLEEESKIQVDEEIHVCRSFYSNGSDCIQTIEISHYTNSFTIAFSKAETLKLIEALQKLVKEL
jgi:hypothetical protein